MDASKDESPPVVTLLDRASRSTRGKRMNKLLDEEIEHDELFWSQEALKEEAEDDNYVEEKEVADEFDSDFGEDEPEQDEEGANDVDDRKEKKKRLVAPGSKKKMDKKTKKKKVISELDSPLQDEKVAEQSTEQDQHDAADGGEVERVVRKSTRTAVIVKQAERDAIRAALQATMKPIKRRKEGEEKRMTQEEMLLEAAQTEIRNLRNLERVLAREEEVKKRAIVHKVVYDGPQTKYLSINGSQYLEFKGGLSFQSLLSATPIPYPKKDVCAITGLPAKYRDPKTGLPYATKEAFKIIRERFLADSKNTRIEMDMGVLYDSIDRKGFLGKRKRTPVANGNKTPHIMHFAQFGMAPAIEIEDSDSD